MAELDIYLSIEEVHDFVNWLFTDNYVLIPDTCQLSVEDLGRKITNINDFESQNKNWGFMNFQYGKYFIEHKKYTKLPMQYHEVYRPVEKKNTYWIRQKIGGPYIDFSIPRIFEDDDKTKFLISANLSYYSQYFNQQSGYNEKAPELLKTAFSGMSRFLKKNATKINLQPRIIYVSKGSIEKFKEGLKLGSFLSDYSDAEIEKLLGI